MQDIIIYITLFLFFLLLGYNLLFHSKTERKKLPPTPPSLPIIGHLHLLKPPVHRFLHKTCEKYGPIISIKFGNRIAIIVSSLSAAEECFTKNDIVLANRPRLTVGKYLTYNYNTIAAANYGDHWRNLRRIGATEIFSTHRLNMFLSIRQDETKRLLRKLSLVSQHGFAKVELKSMLSDLTFNVIMRMVAGKRYFGDEVTNEEEARQFKDLIAQIFTYGGTSNPSDFLPILNWIDGGGFLKNVKNVASRMDKFLQGLINEHRNNEKGSANTMIHHLLSLQDSEPQYYTDEAIKGLILTLLLAGTDTSAVTLEWAMSNLVNHPDVLVKAKKEIESQVGQDRLIDEHELSKLHYLQSIILETLRLYPAAPLLLPHVASNDCTLGGYNVPRNSLLLVNAWAIHRDPTIWDDAESFKPERFENGESEGHKLMPFGLGRRACPGAGLAQRVVGLTLGTLIQCFDWKRISEEPVDMAEGKGLTMPKAKPLEVMCKALDITEKVFAVIAE